MTALEFLMPFLTVALLLGIGVVAVLCIRAERRLADRKNISLGNYKQKNYLFYVTKDVPVFVVALALLVADAVLVVLALTHPVVRLYAIPLGVSAPVAAVVAWLSFSRGKCARDLHVFDEYYVRVQDLLMSKERLESEIGVCRRRVDELRGKLNSTIGSFNKNLANDIPGGFVRELFAPLDGMISGYLADISKFSAEIEKAFNAALAEFLHENTVPELNILPLRAFDEVAVDDLLDSIKTTFGSKIAAIVTEEALNGKVKNAEALGNIMNLLHDLDVQVEEDVLARFLTVAAGFPDRERLAALLYRNKQIPAALVLGKLIPENAEWAFVEGMYGAYHTRDRVAILTELCRGDRRTMCRGFLAGTDAAALSAINTVLEDMKKSGIENGAVRLCRAYRLILGNSYAAGNSGNLFENLALMLFDRRTELGLDDEEQSRVRDICAGGDFLAHSKEIAALYQKGTAAIAPLADSATRILLYYLGSPAGESGLLRPDLLAALLAEYRFTLSFGDLGTYRTLLTALTLLCETDETAAAVLAEWASVPSAVSLTGVTAKESGKRLLAYLTANDRVRLRSVVYRTEKDRQTLDRIVRA